MAAAVNSWSQVTSPEDIVRSLVDFLAQAMVTVAVEGRLADFVGLVLTDFAEDISKYQALRTMDEMSVHEAGNA